MIQHVNKVWERGDVAEVCKGEWKHYLLIVEEVEPWGVVGFIPMRGHEPIPMSLAFDHVNNCGPYDEVVGRIIARRRHRRRPQPEPTSCFLTVEIE